MTAVSDKAFVIPLIINFISFVDIDFSTRAAVISFSIYKQVFKLATKELILIATKSFICSRIRYEVNRLILVNFC